MKTDERNERCELSNHVFGVYVNP